MKYLLIAVLLNLQFSGSVTKNSGEEIPLSKMEFYQVEDIPSGTSISYTFRGKETSIEISKLKRINLKEVIERKKGVTTWLALLVTTQNEKYEVEMDLIEVKGVNSNGKEEVYSSNVINKISL